MTTERIDDGGLAFPTSHRTPGNSGMSLRDWFAGQALASVISPILAQVSKPGPNECLILAATCYELADAMIAARKGA